MQIKLIKVLDFFTKKSILNIERKENQKISVMRNNYKTFAVVTALLTFITIILDGLNKLHMMELQVVFNGHESINWPALEAWSWIEPMHAWWAYGVKIAFVVLLIVWVWMEIKAKKAEKRAAAEAAAKAAAEAAAKNGTTN